MKRSVHSNRFSAWFQGQPITIRAVFIAAILSLISMLIVFALERIFPKKPEIVVMDTIQLLPTVQAVQTQQQVIQTQIASFTTPPPPDPVIVYVVGGKEIRLTIEAILGAGNVKTETVVISYRAEGDAALLLENWSLHDEDGNYFIFPALILHGNGAVQVHSSTGVNTVIDLYWGLNEAVWQSGENALLYDPEGDLRAVFRVP